MTNEECSKLFSNLDKLLDKANICLKEIERLELLVSEYVVEEMKRDEDRISEKFIKYSIEKIDQALLLHKIYNDAIKVMNKILVNKFSIQQEIRDYWNQVSQVITNEIGEQEILGNYILDFTKGKELTEPEKEFMAKTFEGIAKLKK